MSNQILNKHHYKNKPLPSDAVYIGRGSVWQNNWSHKPSKFNVVMVATREEAIEEYRKDLWKRLNQVKYHSTNY